jgi:Uma2 family endonuclease
LHYLEKINPSYFDLLEPLRRWKILSIKGLKEEAEYAGSFSGLYKIISKLEKSRLVGSFVNSWSNEKYIYLLPDGIKALGANERSLNVNKELRFHDSIVTRVARKFSNYAFINETYLDIHTREVFPLLERVPDALVVGVLNAPITMAIEIELTQKSQDRVKQIFRTYSDSKVVNHILYISDKKRILDTYKKYLEELGGEVLEERFLFLYAKDLAKAKEVLELGPVYFKKRITTLRELFGDYLGNEKVISG